MQSGYLRVLGGIILREAKNWHSVKFNAMTRGRDRREEWLWMNYPDPEQLHGYRYLGDNFRERELLKKKKSRWIKKLKGMKPQERKALLSALDETFLKSQDLFKDD